MISVFHDQYFATLQMVQQLTNGGQQAQSDVSMEADDEATVEQQLSSQLAQLAEVLLAALKERVQFLEAHAAGSAILSGFKEHYLDLRSRLIGSLSKCFWSAVTLSNRLTVVSSQTGKERGSFLTC